MDYDHNQFYNIYLLNYVIKLVYIKKILSGKFNYNVKKIMNIIIF